MSTERRTDMGDYVLVETGHPTVENPTAWFSTSNEWKPGTTGANQQSLRDQATAAFTANRTDITQAESIATQAAALAATTGNFTLAQASTHIRSLAQAVKVLADHDASQAKQLNKIMRLLLQEFDGTD